MRATLVRSWLRDGRVLFGVLGALVASSACGSHESDDSAAGGASTSSGGTKASGGTSALGGTVTAAGGARATFGGASSQGGSNGSGGVSGASSDGGALGGVAGANSAGRNATSGGSAQGGKAEIAGASAQGGVVASGGSTGSCDAPPASSALVGWAAQSGMSVSTTTGGGNVTPTTVTTLAALNSAAGGTTAAVIWVKGKLASGNVKVGSNKTIIGLCGAELHGHVDMGGSVNVIFRNLKVVGNNCSDSPNECKSGADAITVNSAAHHLWFDHDDISDGSDGNLDITNGSDFVTVSWTKFSYSTKRTDPTTGSTGHRFSNLIGAADGLAIDVGHLNVTWHHNWWADNIAERMPRSRDGNIHVVNNLFTASGNDYCSNSGNLSHLLVENNVYMGVNNPLQEDDDGNMLARGNVFMNTTGSKTSKGTGFTPPYSFTPDDTSNLASTIMAQAGPR